jgi:enoyl-CoA hydratase
MFSHLLYSASEFIATIAVNRPQVRNALNVATVRELDRAFRQVRDDANVRVAILTGAGDKAFVAGADIGEISRLSVSSGTEFSLEGQAVFNFIESLGKPVIAAINGYALGGGCELAMACTTRIAAESAVFGQPEVKLGLIPGYGGTQRLPRLVGRGQALRLLLNGETISAADALRIGLVDAVVPAGVLMAEAEALARKIAANPPLAVHYCLEAVGRGKYVDEAELFGKLCGTQDMKEGTAAFLEKRPPVFEGR